MQDMGFITHSTHVFLCGYVPLLTKIWTSHASNDHCGTKKRDVWCMTVRDSLRNSTVCDMKTRRWRWAWLHCGKYVGASHLAQIRLAILRMQVKQ